MLTHFLEAIVQVFAVAGLVALVTAWVSGYIVFACRSMTTLANIADGFGVEVGLKACSTKALVCVIHRAPASS